MECTCSSRCLLELYCWARLHHNFIQNYFSSFNWGTTSLDLLFSYQRISISPFHPQISHTHNVKHPQSSLCIINSPDSIHFVKVIPTINKFFKQKSPEKSTLSNLPLEHSTKICKWVKSSHGHWIQVFSSFAFHSLFLKVCLSLLGQNWSNLVFEGPRLPEWQLLIAAPLTYIQKSSQILNKGEGWGRMSQNKTKPEQRSR